MAVGGNLYKGLGVQYLLLQFFVKVSANFASLDTLIEDLGIRLVVVDFSSTSRDAPAGIHAFGSVSDLRAYSCW